jgi:ubiquinone/menaquinone biosynthesis C-methylase UbiE
MTDDVAYALGSSSPEIARLDLQAATLESGTDVLLRRAGIEAGQRVLDLGTGPGHVAFALSTIVGPSGSVVGVDQDPRMLALANARRDEAGLHNVRFVEGDARTYRDAEAFDAVVTRLLLMHLPDRGQVVKHHEAALRRGGRMVLLDYDIGACRAEPELELIGRVRDWLMAGLRAANADPTVGARLAVLLREARFADVATMGVQNYHAPDDPRTAEMFAEVIRSIAPAIIGAGIATEDELGLDTLQDRIERAQAAADAVVLPPTLVAAWGVRR